MFYLKKENLRTGDRLIRKKGGIFSRHHAVYYIKDNNGTHWVAENQNGHGVRLITLQQFLNEGELVSVEFNNLSSYQQLEVIRRINHRLGWSYDLWNYNCEHFANDVLLGHIKSTQIENAKDVLKGTALVCLFVGVIGALSSKS